MAVLIWVIVIIADTHLALVICLAQSIKRALH